MPTVSNQEVWDWPDELDATTAAPRNHLLLFENEHVRVLDTRVPPGGSVPLHTHRWPAALYILSWGDFVRRDGEGRIILDTRAAGKAPLERAVWLPPLPPHSVENVGASELRAIAVELKHP